MSDQTRGNGAASPWGMWSDLMSRMMGCGTAFAPDASPPDAFRQVRSAWLGAWANFWEEFLRSPQFLDLMRQSFNNSFQYRKQFNDFWTEMHHQTQGVSRQDIDQLMIVMQHLEQRLADESGRLGERLDSLSRRMDQLQGSLRAAESRSRAAGS